MKNFTRTLTVVLTLLALAFGTIGVRPARAATTWTVTSLADSSTANAANCPHASNCRLRDAVAAAVAGDTIIFSSGLSGGTIYLASTLTLSKNVTIDGSALASKITISGDTDNNGTGNVRVFSIENGIIAFLNNIVVTHGKITGDGGGIINYGILNIINSTISENASTNKGGGIYNDGSVTVTNSVLSKNSASNYGAGIFNHNQLMVMNSTLSENTTTINTGSAGGIYNDNSLTVIDSTFSGNSSKFGGGIENTGTATVIKSLITNNSTYAGGGIYNTSSGVLSVTSSTISGNSATEYAGGIFNYNSATLTLVNSTLSGNFATNGDGGGVENSGAATIANSTIYGNSAGYSGGGIYNQGSLAITNSTLFNNHSAINRGGGVYNVGGELNYSNTIIANSSSGNDCVLGGGGATIGTNLNNLVEDGSCSSSLSGDPNLSLLADNGGSTQTMALMTGSPAINMGDVAVCESSPINGLDQRDAERISCDIGSYAYDGVLTYSFSGQVKDENDNPIEGVLISDDYGHTAITDSAGNYTLTHLSSGNYVITPSQGSSSYTSFSPTSRIVYIQSGNFSGQNFTAIRTPVFILPGIAGTYAKSTSNDIFWLLNRGVHPDELTVDPLAHFYDDIIVTLKNAGYVEGKDLFVVSYDWRLAPAPIDGTFDGHIDGLTASGISDNTFEYGVDYLGYYLKKATDQWNDDHPGAPLDKVDLVVHSTGGIIARTYIESDAYGELYDATHHLPKINNLIMVGVPNRGAAKAWNPLHNDWKDDLAFHFVLSKILNRAYQKLLHGCVTVVTCLSTGEPIHGPDYPNGVLTEDSPALLDSNGDPDPVKFIDLYVPTIRGLLSTYAFLDRGDGAGYVNVNDLPAERNNILLDLNNGYDTSAPGDPNGFTDPSLVTKVYVIYGDGLETHEKTISSTVLIPNLFTNRYAPFDDITWSVRSVGELKYENITGMGDETVPTISSAGQFLNCNCVKLMKFTNALVNNDPNAKHTAGLVTHTGLMGNVDVQKYILEILGHSVPSNQISTGLARNDISNIKSVVVDPVEFVMTDGAGRRFGYTEATGPLTEIPGSVYYGGADGAGWIYGNLQEPVNIQLNGLDQSYYVMVSGEQFENGGEILSGNNLASGSSITLPLVVKDFAPPTVNSFTAPVSSASLNIPITAFTASDNKNVTGYMVTNSSTPPAADATGWSGVAPTVYAVSSNGNYTLYPWVKDAAGNVSAVYNSPVTVTVTAFVVSNTNDSGAGSLRATIASATSGSTIVFAPALSGQTIYLASTLTLTKNVTIDGSDMPLKITISGDSDQDGTGDVRVFAINSGVTALFNSLIIAKGKVDSNSFYGFGGGVYNNGNLTITNSTLSNNSAVWGGGIFNYSGSALVVTKSTFSGNSASEGGGGIANSGSLIVKASTISGNLAAYSGGGVYNNYSGTLALTNSTVSGNSVSGDGGGIYNYFGALTLSNSTISGNSAGLGGGVRNWSGLFKYSNTIIANSNLGGDCAVNSSISVNTNNLVEDGSCSASLSGDPKLGALADNGGGTQTMALKAGSPATDTGSDTICAQSPVDNFDQRGLARPVGAHCDIGAYEGSLPDTSKPVVSAFAVPATSTSLNIPITTFTATDNVAVAGYKVTTSSTPPGAGAAGWTASAPTAFAVGASGTYTLYPWAKDAAGNVSAVFATPRTVVVMKERSKNGGFETYVGASKIPTSWSAGNTFSTSDGKDINIHREGAASVKIVGAAGKTKRLAQTINLSGASGDKFVFTFWVKGNSIPATGLCRGEVQFYNGATLTQTKAINCSTGTTGFQKKSVTFTVNAAYTKIVIRFTYSKASGTVWFDGVSLMK